MVNRYIHAIAVPEDVIKQPRGNQAERVASAGTLTSDLPAVESVAPGAPGRTVAGVVGGQYASLTATEFEELFGASGIAVVPMYSGGGDPQIDGYYATEDVTLDRPASTQADLQRFDGRLTKQGTRRSHFRAVRTTPTDVSNPFGSATTEEIGIPAAATDVRWFDGQGTSQTTEAATVQRTETGEHADLDIYDCTEPSFSNPTLVYDAPYADGWPVDVRVWDDHDRTKTTSTPNGSVVQWQRVYRSDHDEIGEFVCETDVLRVRLDEANTELDAFRWDSGTSSYSSVSLGSSSWRFQRGVFTYVGVEAIDGRLVFSDGSSSHTLLASFKRGYDDILFANPPNAGTVPSGLVTRLDPIAHDSDRDPAGSAGIVARKEVD